MSRLLLLLFLVTGLEAFSQTRGKYVAYMAINLNDCVNCIQTIRQFNDLPKSLSPKLLFREIDKRIAQVYLKKQIGIFIDDKNIVYSDSLFKALENYEKGASLLHILFDNQHIKSFQLNAFQFVELLPYSNIKTNIFKLLPDSVVLGNIVRVKKGKNLILLEDNQFQQVFVADIKTKKLLKVISGSDFDNKNIYKLIFGDTVGFYKRVQNQEKILEKVGKTRPYIQAAHIADDDRIFIEISLALVDKDVQNNSLVVTQVSIIIELRKGFSNFIAFHIKDHLDKLEKDGYETYLNFLKFEIIEKKSLYNFFSYKSRP